MKICVLLTFFLFLTSCSFVEAVSSDSKPFRNIKKTYSLIDKSGTFTLVRHTGKSKEAKTIITKSEVLDKSFRALEQVITISIPGKIGTNINVLNPKKSQYTTWLDGKKYISKMSIDHTTKNLKIDMQSPVETWNGSKSIQLPRGSGVFCFYSQLVECVRTTGFFSKAVSKNSGVMSFHIIWEGFPYFQDQYLGVANQAISKAKISYNGISKTGLKRFSLDTANQVIMYQLNSNFELSKQFWISQGYSLLEKN